MKELMNEQLQAINLAFNGTTLAYSMLARKLGLSYNSLMVLYSIEMNEIQMNKNCTQKLICDETHFFYKNIFMFSQFYIVVAIFNWSCRSVVCRSLC